MSTEPADMSDDRSVLARRRAKPGHGRAKEVFLNLIRKTDSSITHYIIAYSAGNKEAGANLERLKAALRS